LNETLAALIVARLKQDGHLSLEDLASRLLTSDLGEVEGTLAVLTHRSDVKRSHGGQYYVSGFVTPPAPVVPRAKRAARTAVVQFGVMSGSGRGFEVDGQLVMPGDMLTHPQLRDLFRVKNMGGIRVSTTVGAIVVISSADNDLYEDREESGILHYTGEGRHGDQKLTDGNRAIDESASTGRPILLFFKKATNEYEFHGEVRLAGAPAQERQADEDGLMRNVWVFPLETV